MSLRFNSISGKSNKEIINSLKFLTDKGELTVVIGWLHNIAINMNVTNNAELPAIHVQKFKKFEEIISGILRKQEN